MVELLKVFQKSPTVNNTLSDSPPPAKSTMDGQVGRVSPNYVESRMVELDYRRIENNRCVGLLPDAAEHDAYKMLRIQIGQRMQANGWNTLMVASPRPAEGRTVTAINLAAMFAREYQRTVLLVDADLRRQSVQALLGYENHKGLVDHLLDGCPIKDIIVWPGVEKLTIISGGRTIHESAELLGSSQMAAFMQEIRQRYRDRFIILDTPPLLDSADTLALAPLVDGIVVVVDAGKTPMPDIQKALALLPQEKILGLVMNRRA
jgi:non-specific protein-tyrosine kinase